MQSSFIFESLQYCNGEMTNEWKFLRNKALGSKVTVKVSLKRNLCPLLFN
jgi:hypothetical protein